METEQLIKYWIESSNEDFPLINDLFDKGYFLWSLFITHLVVEKLLKACYTKNIDNDVPKIHNLLVLSKKVNLNLDSSQLKLLDTLNLFQISARYPDYKNKMNKLCSREYTEELIKKSKEFIEWLKSQLK